MDSVQKIIVDKNFVGHIRARYTTEIIGNTLDKYGGILICSFGYPKPCKEMQVTNNVVAGSIYAGFVTMGHDCDDKAQKVFKDNLAHSIDGGIDGVGALIYNDPSSEKQKTCMEVGNFKGYKCGKEAIFTWPAAKRVVVKNVVAIDCVNGIGVGAA